MTNTSTATTGASAAAAVSNAIKASGAIVRVEPEDFLDILEKSSDPIVVQSPPGFLTRHKYLTSYKGLFFCAKSDFSGYHACARTLSQHNKNAKAYQEALNKRKIYR